ncbi:hypothetical protein SLEP1_g26134 [Rubroshorea leprosula]|uniref:Uncharacterized protein n=1 Tax=Rubroshorea leprosula TaxID=152421 RepID=A0AAV5JRK2_9ROSI|nr:hypothetical protein SLEP1_g26134 [Rubroshorea leprosula]
MAAESSIRDLTAALGSGLSLTVEEETGLVLDDGGSIDTTRQGSQYCLVSDHVEWDCELGLEMEQLSVKERPYNEKLRAVPRHLQRAKEASRGRWLRDASGNRGDWGVDRGLTNDHPRQDNQNVICIEQATDSVGRISHHGLGTANMHNCVDLGLTDCLERDNKRKVFDLNVEVPNTLNFEHEKDSKKGGNGVLPNDSSLAGPILQAQPIQARTKELGAVLTEKNAQKSPTIKSSRRKDKAEQGRSGFSSRGGKFLGSRCVLEQGKKEKSKLISPVSQRHGWVLFVLFLSGCSGKTRAETGWRRKRKREKRNKPSLSKILLF